MNQSIHWFAYCTTIFLTEKLNPAEIAGIVIGGLLGIVGIIVIIGLIVVWASRKDSEDITDPKDIREEKKKDRKQDRREERREDRREEKYGEPGTQR